jgi:hypothetical protein
VDCSRGEKYDAKAPTPNATPMMARMTDVRIFFRSGRFRGRLSWPVFATPAVTGVIGGWL